LHVLNLLGLLSYDAGDQAKAIECFTRAIDINPCDAASHFHRGMALQKLQHWEAALASYDKAIALTPDHVEAHLRRGHVLRQNRQLEAALASYDRAIAIKSDYAEAYCSRGNVLKSLGRFEAALDSYDRALSLMPDYVDCHFNKGLLLNEVGRRGEALTSFDRAIALRPGYADAYVSRGNVLHELGQVDAALRSYNLAIEGNASHIGALVNRGIVLHEVGQLDAALASYDQAIALRPDGSEAYLNRGNVLQEMGRLEAALASFDRAITLRPDSAEAYSNRGNVLQQLQRVDEAMMSFDQSIAIRPDYAEAHYNKAMCSLLAGDFANGWNGYEWRLKSKQWSRLSENRDFPVPLWLGGQSLEGRTILLHSEQGLGDSIQFCRYAKLLADFGARVILEVQRPLGPVLADLEGVAQVLLQGDALPHFDYHCSLMSLPLAFRTTLSNVPSRVPYLKARPTDVLRWRGMLGERRGMRIGLVWSGGLRPNQPELRSVNERRNVPLAKFAVLKNPGIEFFSLQKGQPAESELARLRAQNWDGPEIRDFSDELRDFSDTAALVESLDLVISVDTSVAHVAGALGKPVWLLNRYDTCWRWMLNRSDSPWYPTMRIYRQEAAGDWDGVLRRVREDVRRL
jgi:tetratricopeptide (TPR) repeat protein